jgi:hypothetical protein
MQKTMASFKFSHRTANIAAGAAAKMSALPLEGKPLMGNELGQ